MLLNVEHVSHDYESWPYWSVCLVLTAICAAHGCVRMHACREDFEFERRFVEGKDGKLEPERARQQDWVLRCARAFLTSAAAARWLLTPCVVSAWYVVQSEPIHAQEGASPRLALKLRYLAVLWSVSRVLSSLRLCAVSQVPIAIEL